jgi:hypothetical protein
VPAPAVIPAPRAYINAVAVKGFVVELWLVTPRSRPFPTVKESLNHNPRTSETKTTGAFYPPPDTRAMHAGGRPCSLL